MESSIVIKVNYGETLRRFNACLADDKLGLNLDGLRDKIFQLFKFPPDSELTLTYIDEDGDVVALVDDEDLQDITRQDLDPLRISVRLNTGKLSRSSGTSSGNAASFRTPLVKPTFSNTNSSVSDRFKFSRESKSRKIRKHSADMVSKASSTAREIAELSKHLSKTGLSFLKLACPVVEGIAGSFRNGEPSQATNVEELTFKTAGQPKNHTGSTDAFTSKFPQPDKTGIQCESLSKSPRPKSSLVDSKKEEGKKFGDCRLVGKALGISYSSSSTTGPEKRSNEQPSENHPRAEHVGVVGSYSLTGVHVLNSSSSTTGPEKRANKQPTENHPGAKPVGGVGSYSVTPVVNSSSLTTGPDKRANKQPSENPGAEPVGAVGLYSVTGVPVVKDTIQHQCSSFQVPVKKRSHNHCDRTASIFHRGVRCDGCGVYPITGPRFKSKVKEDYDLCSICFAQMGNDADYIRMDRPVKYHHPAALGALHDPCDFFQGWGVKSPKLDSLFTQDVNVLDGTIMAPLTPFTKVWRMRNNGNIVWPQGTRLVWIGGCRLSDAISVELQISSDGVAVGHDLDVAVDFTAPELPGCYISTWRMALPSGEKFGQSVWVLIQVFSTNPPKKRVFYEASQDLNLNFPPDSNGIAGSETINANADMTTESIIPDPKISNPAMDLVGPPVVDGNRNKEQDSNSCISLSAAGSSISCPIDLSEAAPAVTSPAPPSVTEVQASSQDCRENSDIEMTLLKELEEMGFKQVNLNKEVLRMNKYDLDQAVDDLCGISEWDPMLEELEGMGFCNKEMNKKLLKKNNGSIKRVVMDLIAGEN